MSNYSLIGPESGSWWEPVQLAMVKMVLERFHGGELIDEQSCGVTSISGLSMLVLIEDRAVRPS